MSADSIERPFSFASYSCVWLTSVVTTSLKVLTSLELNNKDADLARPHVFYRVWRKRWQPLSTRGERWISGLAAIERDFAMLVPAYEMAESLNVSDSAPAMRMQRNDFSWWNVCVHDAHPIVFEQQVVVRGSGYKRVKRVWPRPRVWVCENGILAHGYACGSVSFCSNCAIVV